MNKILLFFFIVTTSVAVQAQITHSQFQQIAKAFQEEYSQELAQKNAILMINPPPSPQLPNFWWEQNEKHGSYSGFFKNGMQQHMIFLFGGYARIPGMTPDGVAMTLCHELGHGIGGPPYKDKGNDERVSTEGQADDFATRHCIKRLFKYIPEFQSVMAPSSYTDSLCRSRFTTPEDLYHCFRGFQALEVERLYFREHEGNKQETNYETPDPRVADQIDHSPTYYPSPQCRLDTMVAGLLKQERPRCWFVPN